MPPTEMGPGHQEGGMWRALQQHRAGFPVGSCVLPKGALLPMAAEQHYGLVGARGECPERVRRPAGLPCWWPCALFVSRGI